IRPLGHTPAITVGTHDRAPTGVAVTVAGVVWIPELPIMLQTQIMAEFVGGRRGDLGGASPAIIEDPCRLEFIHIAAGSELITEHVPGCDTSGSAARIRAVGDQDLTDPGTTI